MLFTVPSPQHSCWDTLIPLFPQNAPPSARLPSHCLWRFICVHISSWQGHGLRVRETRVQIPALLCV